MEAHTDAAFIRQARRSVVIADSSKIGRVTFARICGIDAVSDLVTDGEIGETALADLESAGVKVITA
jgi:DeoR family transcriptional regulator of aga operon